MEDTLTGLLSRELSKYHFMVSWSVPNFQILQTTHFWRLMTRDIYISDTIQNPQHIVKEVKQKI